MGQLANLLLALVAVAVADGVGPLVSPRPEWLPLLVLTPYLLLPALRHAVRRGDGDRANRVAARARISPVAVQLVADLAFGWGAWLGVQRGPSDLPPGWPTPWELLRFLPFVLATVASLDACARGLAGAVHGRRWFVFQLRSFVGFALPFVLLIAVDGSIALHEELAWSIQIVSLYAGAHSVGLLLALTALVPVLLTHAWGAEPLPRGPVRDLVELVVRRTGLVCKDVYLWRTGRSMANAMIVGVLPRTRRVFFSDSLLEALPPRELIAVTAHEIGHARRGHMAQFLMLALGGFGVIGALARLWEPSWFVPFELGALGVLALGVFGFRWLSRRFELEADLFAVEITGDPAAIGSALLRLGGRLRDIAGWRHFAPSARDAFLRRANEDPQVLAAFRARMTRARVAVALVFLIGFGGALALRVAALGEERLQLALWQGDFAVAAARAEGLDLPVEDRAFLLFASEALGDRGDALRRERAERIAERALEALRAEGIAERSTGFTAAAAVMGHAQATRAMDAFDAREDGTDDWRAGLPERWRVALEGEASESPVQRAGAR